MASKKSLKEYENRHNQKFPNNLIKVIKRNGRHIYFETEFGICKKDISTFGKNNYDISSAIDKIDYFNKVVLKLYDSSKYTFSIDNYKNNKQIVQMKCVLHGKENKIAAHVLSGKAGCRICANNLNNPNNNINTDIFIQNAKLIHKDRYDYSLVDYKDNRTLIKIICKEHGIFTQTPNNHLKPSNCPKCNNELKHLKCSGWSKHRWLNSGNSSKNFDSFKVYIIECWNETEKFYKIGRTFTTVEKRFKNSEIPYNYKIIKIFKGSAEKIYNLEQELKHLNKEYKYIPLLNFRGKFECFSQIK